MTRWTIATLCIALVLCLGACGGDEVDGGSGGTTAAPLATPKASIAHQFELLKAQKVDELRACFTVRLRDAITAEAVADAQGEVGGMTMDDLYAGEEPGEWEGKQTMKVKMKGGRTLTTLVLTDGEWLSDTIWFR